MSRITIGEGIQRVQSIYSSGLQSDDTRLSSRHVYSVLLSSRAIILKQQSNAGRKISQWSYQTLPCIELERASISECRCANPRLIVLKSGYVLPKLITDIRDHMFKSVTTLDGLVRFDEEDFEMLKYSAGNKYTADKPSFFIKNSGRLFLTNRDLLKTITLEALFYDPIEVFQFPSNCDDELDCPDCKECVDIMSLELPMDGDLLKGMTDIIFSELVILLKQMKEDTANNAQDDSSAQGKMVHT